MEPRPIPKNTADTALAVDAVDEKAQPTEPTPADMYWNWVKLNPMLTVNDVAVFAQEGGVIVVLTDKIGRSISTASFFIPADVLAKMTSLKKKS